MKKICVVFSAVCMLALSCSYFTPVIRVKDVINEKKTLDNAQNPAKKYLIMREISRKLIEIKNVKVKDVTQSTNIDYDFCVIVDVPVDGTIVECYVYSKNISRISKLEKNVTRIDVKGEFGRFFTTLDDSLTKIEIIKAKISVKEQKKS